jgi:methionine aminopeptidase
LIDGNDCIINKETPTDRVEGFEFAPGDIIGLDIYVSTGEGKPKESEFRTTVFKRELEAVYQLKLKSSRAFFTEVNKRFPTLPFSLRNFEDQTQAKVGMRECGQHGMLNPYYVLQEKEGEYVAHFMCTIAVQPRSTAILAGNLPVDVSRYESENSVKDEGFKSLLARDLWKDEKVKKEKK